MFADENIQHFTIEDDDEDEDIDENELKNETSFGNKDENDNIMIKENNNGNAWYINEGENRIRINKVQRFMRTLTILSAIGGFLFGYDTGVVSGAMLPLTRMMSLSREQEEVIVSCTILAAAISSSICIGNVCNQRIGRRGSIIFASIVFTIGSVLLAIAWDYNSLVLGRVIVGVGIGITSLTTPIYLAEVAMSEKRGQLVTINALFVCIGQFIAGMVDGICSVVSPDNGWRIMLGLAAVPSVIMFFGFVFLLPESPRWLISKGKIEEGKKVMHALRYSDEEADQEVEEVLNSLEEEEGDSDDNNGQKVVKSTKTTTCVGNFLEMIYHTPTRRALYVGCGLMILQQFSGINTIMYYAATIYQMSGEYSETTSIWLSGFTALAQVVTVLLSIYFIERVGRRVLILTSLGLVSISLLGLGMTFYAHRAFSDEVLSSDDDCSYQDVMVWDGVTRYCYDCIQIPNCGYLLDRQSCVTGNETMPFLGSNDTITTSSSWYYDSCPIHNKQQKISGYLSVFFMILYLLAFGIGMGGLPWTINSEIYILQYRSTATSISTSVNWIGNMIISATFLTLSDTKNLTPAGAFWFYGTISIIGFVWIYCVLPETKGKSLEDIEYLFMNTDYSKIIGESEMIIMGGDDDEAGMNSTSNESSSSYSDTSSSNHSEKENKKKYVERFEIDTNEIT